MLAAAAMLPFGIAMVVVGLVDAEIRTHLD